MDRTSFSMKGLLSFRILCYLRTKEMCGDDIAKMIGNSFGKKPSPGTIYPALKELEKKGLIKGEKVGKMVCYNLTKKGKREADTACRIFLDIFSDIIKEMS